MPRIAVVMTAYNRQDYLPQAVQSVFDQTFEDWSLTIVDDKSTDLTRSAMRRIAELDGRVRLILNREHLGAGGAIERGMRAAIECDNPEFVCWVDSDDILKPEALERTLRFMDSRPETGLVYTRFQTMDAQGNETAFARVPKLPYTPNNLMLEPMVFHFRLMRTEAYLESGGFDPDMTAAIDYDLMLRVSEGHIIRHLPEVLYLYRIHTDTISRSTEQQKGQAELSVRRAKLRRGIPLDIDVQPEYPNPQHELEAVKQEVRGLTDRIRSLESA